MNETARSYKMLSQEADTIEKFTFVWFTDGIGWKSARGNLRETFEVMDTIYSIDDMENGIMEKVFYKKRRPVLVACTGLIMKKIVLLNLTFREDLTSLGSEGL